LKTVSAKSHAEGLAVNSFASLRLRTHPLLTFIMSSKCNLILFFFFFLKIIWASKTHNS